VFDLDTADRACPSCGGELRPMQGQFDESEMIDFVEISYRVVKVKQQKYVYRCGGCVETAPGPERATRGGRYSLAFAIKVALDKYLDHLPLARQERILRRHGVQVTTQTLWDQLAALAERRRRKRPCSRMPSRSLSSDSIKRAGRSSRQTRPSASRCGASPLPASSAVGSGTTRAPPRSRNSSAATKHHRVRRSQNVRSSGSRRTGHPARRLLGSRVSEVRGSRSRSSRGQPRAEMDRRASRHRREGTRRSRANGRAPSHGIEASAGQVQAWLWAQAVLKTLSIGKAAAYTIANWDRPKRFTDDARIPLDRRAPGVAVTLKR
jgi:transposase